MLIQFKPTSFKRLESPYDECGQRYYVAVLEAKELPAAISEWRKINLRDAKLTTKVAEQIRETISDRPDMFLFRNRGLVMMVKSAEYDNKAGILSLYLDDSSRHGLLDGGHTFKLIMEAIENEPEGGWQPLYLKMEILEGFNDVNEVVEIVGARNRSTQVKDQSTEELRGSYTTIHEIAKSQPYVDQIAYKEYELDDEEKPKPVDIRDILSYVVCFDIDSFDSNTHPLKAYVSKQQVVEHFKGNEKLKRFASILNDILRLRDTIYHDLPIVYNDVGGREERGKFGGLTGVQLLKRTKAQLYFTSTQSQYRIPTSYIYPLLAAFRNLVVQNGGRYEWKQDPFAMWDEEKGNLVKRFGEDARKIQNPNKLGKDPSVWRNCYDAITIATLRNR